MPRRILTLLVVGVLIPACKNDPAFLPPLPEAVIKTQLRGSQVVPAVATPVTTTNATLTIPQGHQSMDYSVTYTGSGTITAVEIRLGVAGTNGPLLFTLATAPFTNPLTGTVTAFDLVSVPSQGIFFFKQALDRIIAGEAYVLISTVGVPTGEMRGQLGAATLASAVLNGAQEVPPVAGTGTGTFTLSFDSTQATITATLTFSGLTSSADAAHLHFGSAGTGGGPIVFNLSTVPFTSPLVVTLTSTDVLTLSFEDAIDALMTGYMYVNVHTTTNAGGEIRGQVGPARLTADLKGSNVAPPVVSGFTGAADVILNAMQTEALVLLTHDVLTPNSVRLCTEDPGFNGPLLYDVDALAGSAASPLKAILQNAQLIPSPPRAILTFTDFASALLTGKTYLEVRSPSFPDGAVRGQILPVP
jgi:hypothetical protein